MEEFIQHMINGITIGAFYALVALGYTMVYGVLKMINFAHGDLFMWGAYVGWTALAALLAVIARSGPGLIVPAFVAAMVTVGLIGVLIERMAYRPLRRASRLAPIISALGAAFVLESVARNVWGASYKVYPSALVPDIEWRLLGNVHVGVVQVTVMLVSVLLMAGLYLFVQYTKIGTAMRAVSLDHDISRLMGINVDRIIATVFLIGPALGAAGGVMVGLHYGSFDFTLGWIFGLKAFVAAILGGIGNIPGAMVGGLILGIVESLGAGYISSQWKDVIAYWLLIVILIVRPRGLLGERVAEKY
ncbi:MAG: ABC transporter permease [Anaerolineae bacterium SM23_84]|nr:MAG: ABC transporter permease [Anaerolineae bacterium SM23_84]